MRLHGKTKLGFFPLPAAEATRLKNCLAFASEFSALDPCVGDGVAFCHLLQGVTAYRYGVEIDANRAEQAKALGIETLQANAMDVRCPAEAVSLLYLNPPYDWECGEGNNQRLELVERNGIGDTADSVWRALTAEHQKLFPGRSQSDDASITETPGILLETQPEPAGLVESAMDAGALIVFGQRPQSLSRKKRRDRLAVPEQASLFGFS